MKVTEFVECPNKAYYDKGGMLHEVCCNQCKVPLHETLRRNAKPRHCEWWNADGCKAALCFVCYQKALAEQPTKHPRRSRGWWWLQMRPGRVSVIIDWPITCEGKMSWECVSILYLEQWLWLLLLLILVHRNAIPLLYWYYCDLAGTALNIDLNYIVSTYAGYARTRLVWLLARQVRLPGLFARRTRLMPAWYVARNTSI